MDGSQGELINTDSFKPCFGKTWVAMLICRLRGVLRFCSFKSVHSYTATSYYQSFLTRHACTSLIICLRCERCTWQVYPTKWGKHRLWTPYLKMWGQPTMWLRSGTASDAMLCTMTTNDIIKQSTKGCSVYTQQLSELHPTTLQTMTFVAVPPFRWFLAFCSFLLAFLFAFSSD